MSTWCKPGQNIFYLMQTQKNDLKKKKIMCECVCVCVCLCVCVCVCVGSSEACLDEASKCANVRGWLLVWWLILHWWRAQTSIPQSLPLSLSLNLSLSVFLPLSSSELESVTVSTVRQHLQNIAWLCLLLTVCWRQKESRGKRKRERER